MRLAFIKTKVHVQKIEKKLKSKEKIDEELDVIGFEQLQSENKVLKKKLAGREQEINRVRKKIAQNCSTISNLEDNIEATKTALKDNKESVKVVDGQISCCGKELSSLTSKYKVLQKNFKIKSAAASNKVVQEHYLSSKEEVKALTLELENLKKEHHTLMRTTR
jgi:predicted  nucleic acid-binding Zn-ribbon protein